MVIGKVIRITAGTLRGRRLASPTHADVRPTPSKVREALFNILGNIEGWRILDLFAGSGLMALEAISRGASVISVEKIIANCNSMQSIRYDWKLEKGWHIINDSLPSALHAVKSQNFDLVYADPPYAQSFCEQIPDWLASYNIRTPRLIIEEAARITPHWPEGWTIAQSRRYGDTCLYFLEPEEQP